MEITLDILSRVVPTESVLDCKSVCTTWRSLVRHPSFSEMHLHHVDYSGKLGFLALTADGRFQCFEYNERNHDEPIQSIRRSHMTSPFKENTFVGSCNGLICLARRRSPSVCICNPITREYVMLPEIKKDSCEIERYVTGATSFGHVSSTNEYKVVGTYVSQNNVEVYIYTLGSGSGWRNLRNLNYQFREDNWNQAGIFANGALYWIDVELEMIVTFDLAMEKFCEHLPPPSLPPDSDWGNYRIGVLNGILSFAAYLDLEEDECFNIWLLKHKNDNHEIKEREEHQTLGWSVEFMVEDSELLAVTSSDCILTYDYYYLKIYDTKNSPSKRLLKLKNCVFPLTPHKNTLVSLKELGEEDTKVIE